MAKATTTWRPETGLGEIDNANLDDFLLLETGDNLLLETGDALLLEDSVLTAKATTSWTQSDT